MEEDKAPGSKFQGLIFSSAAISQFDGPRAFPSATVQKNTFLSLAFRSKSQKPASNANEQIS
jgi:hypothetical protein